MPNPILTAAIDAVASGTDLSAEEAGRVLREIMGGEVSEVQTAAFLIALRTKGETVGELAGLARTMRALATTVDAGDPDRLIDTAGTGGGVSTFNVSTTAAFVAAGAGCRVAKHGNRSATSICGSADVLEALGARIDLTPGDVARCINETGFGFMFAPAHHKATLHVVPVRRELAVRTIFNFLGPLTNPAGAARQLVGVSDPARLELIAGALAELGCRHAMVVSGEDGLDEMSVSGNTRIVEVTPRGIAARTLAPGDMGLARAPLDALAGGTPEQNAAITREVLGGAPGPRRDLVVANAAAALVVAERAESLVAGAELAANTIDSGAALEALERFVALTRAVAVSAPAGGGPA